jgi:hypothetical protein
LTINSGSTAAIPKAHTVNDTAATTPVRIFPGAGTETLHIIETASTVTIGASAGNDTFNVNTSGVGTSNVFLDSSHTLATLNIGAGGRVTLEPAGTHVLRTNNLTVNGTLDLNNNTMIVDYAGASPLAAIRSRLTSGYAGGAWTGSGITSERAATVSNHALGYAESSALFSSFPATFAGQQVDDTALLVRYTRYGDTNLDRQVNLVDFNRVAANFGTGALWSNGNSNYDATINLLDFNLLAANFGQPVVL